MIETTVALLGVLAWVFAFVAQVSARRSLEEARRYREAGDADWARGEEMRDHAVSILHDAMELRERYDRGPRDA